MNSSFWHTLAMSDECEQAVKESSLPNAPAKPGAVNGEPAAEVGGPSGLEPTRFGDWERKGRCIDF
jgi:hypothetical protein